MTTTAGLQALYPFLHGKVQEPGKMATALLDSVEQKARDSRDTNAAFHAWHLAVQRKRQQKVSLRPVADVLIGAFALRFDGLLTRNATDFKTLFPTLNLVAP